MEALDVLSLAAAKAFVNERTTVSDEELTGFIAPAVRRVERHLQVSILDRQSTEVRTALCGRVVLRWRPVTAVTSIESVDGLRSWQPATLRADLLERGFVQAHDHALPLFGEVEVAYSAGRESVTDDEQLAVKVVLAEYWRTQRTRIGRASYGSAPAAVVEADTGPAGGAALRVRLTEILGDPVPLGFA